MRISVFCKHKNEEDEIEIAQYEGCSPIVGQHLWINDYSKLGQGSLTQFIVTRIDISIHTPTGSKWDMKAGLEVYVERY